MNLLLDTHTLIWWMADDPRLDEKARDAIINVDNVTYVSSVTLWEIAIKHSLGKLELPPEFDEELADEGFMELPVKWEHARRNRELPWIHRDPFVRMLVAQAQSEDIVLVTADREIRRYDVACL